MVRPDVRGKRLTPAFQSKRPIQRVAWIRVGALGDLAVGLASLIETIALFPGARLTVVGPKLWTEILDPKLYPAIEQIAVIDRRQTTARIFVPDGARWRETVGISLHKIFRGTDAVVNTNVDSLRYGFSAFFAGVRLRIGAAPAPMAWLYTYASPFFGKDPLLHERDVPLLVLELAVRGLARFTQTLTRNRERLTAWVEKSVLIARWRTRGLPPGKKPDPIRGRALAGVGERNFVLVNPTSSRREKAWPAEKFRELCLSARNLLADQGCEIVIIGSPKETAWLREVAGDDFHVIQPSTIGDLQDVLALATGLLTNTSSVQFIAAMTSTPTITLMGRANPLIWGPVGPNDRFISGQPPAELAHDIFAQEQEGYRSIEVAKVFAAFVKWPEQVTEKTTEKTTEKIQ